MIANLAHHLTLTLNARDDIQDKTQSAIMLLHCIQRK